MGLEIRLQREARPARESGPVKCGDHAYERGWHGQYQREINGRCDAARRVPAARSLRRERRLAGGWPKTASQQYPVTGQSHLRHQHFFPLLHLFPGWFSLSTSQPPCFLYCFPGPLPPTNHRASILLRPSPLLHFYFLSPFYFSSTEPPRCGRFVFTPQCPKQPWRSATSPSIVALSTRPETSSGLMNFVVVVRNSRSRFESRKEMRTWPSVVVSRPAMAELV